MKYQIITPMPISQEDSLIFFRDYEKKRQDLFIDFSDEPIEKVLFLDIDGVLQPFSQYRFDYLHDKEGMEKLYVSMQEKHQIDYRELDKYDFTAVVYDWYKPAVHELKRILDKTGAKIVVSSDWRSGSKVLILPFLFRIHDLEKYLYGYTPMFYDIYELIESPEYKNISRHRSIEIKEYLKEHPHIKKWVAVDDINMTEDIFDNFVHVYPYLTEENADRCIEILGSDS